jgi:site-specific DNA-cytosine methylase
MRALELFAGTHSISRALEEKGWHVDSLDAVSDFNPTFCMDFRDFDFQSIPPGTYDFVWASPPCTEFSRAKTTGIRDFETADALVKQTLECIEHLAPRYWAMENPATGLLPHRPYMADVPVVCVLDYCKYGTRYKKPTQIWGVMPETL